jgi:hypothetical protein
MPEQVVGSRTAEQPVLLVELERDLPVPADGWAAELSRRGVEIVQDDLGRLAVDRATARVLFAEHREQQEAAARRRAEIERRVIAADEARRAALPKGIPMSEVPPGMTAAALMMASDPFPATRRTSVLEDALAHGSTSTARSAVSRDRRRGAASPPGRC